MTILSMTDVSQLEEYEIRQFVINGVRQGTRESRRAAIYMGWSTCPFDRNEFFITKVWIPSCYSTPCNTVWYCVFSMRNFENIRMQTNQEYFPVVADDGVFQFMVDIVLSHPNEFPQLFPMMWIFHIAKIAVHCAGKLSKKLLKVLNGKRFGNPRKKMM